MDEHLVRGRPMRMRHCLVRHRQGVIGQGYVYSICEMVGLRASKADLSASFCQPFLPETAAQLDCADHRPDAVTRRSRFSQSLLERSTRSSLGKEFDALGDFLIGFGFSDQCYLAKLAVSGAVSLTRTIPLPNDPRLCRPVVRETRRCLHAHNHDAKRLTHRSLSYVHRNIPKGGVKRIRRRLRSPTRSRTSASCVVTKETPAGFFPIPTNPF